MQFQVEIPNIDPSKGVDQRYITELVAAGLYNEGILTEAEARKVVGATRREFQEILPKHGFTYLDQDQETIDTELQYLNKRKRV